MPDALATALLQEIRQRFHGLKEQAERAIAQVPPEAFFGTLDEESNSIGLIMKHVGGNLRSRWRDFLSSDGEKPDRHRDLEFQRTADDSVESTLALWNEGWGCLANTLESLGPDDLLHTVHIRGEAHTVVQAIERSLVHTAGHAGQIVLLAKHAAGPGWRTLSISRGASDAFTREMHERQRGRQ